MNTSHWPVFHAFGVGITLGQILQWIETYGLPLVLQVLAQIFGNTQIASLTVQQIVTWIAAALPALAAGKPLPPLPTPAPTPQVKP